MRVAIPQAIRFESYGKQGWSFGKNRRTHFYLSRSNYWRGPKFEFEWHNYPTHTETRFISVGWGAVNGRSYTLWVPDRFLRPLLRRLPAKVYRKYDHA